MAEKNTRRIERRYQRYIGLKQETDMCLHRERRVDKAEAYKNVGWIYIAYMPKNLKEIVNNYFSGFTKNK